MNGRILNVTAALLWQEEQVLIAQRPPQVANGSLWELPGGKIEFGERPEQCLLRELAEELGLAAKVGPIYGVFSHLPTDDLQILLVVYHCQPGELAPRPLQCQQFRWVTPSVALSYPLAPLDRKIIRQLAAATSQ
jgi:8-oxo-dGTP diphosphatase